MLGCNVDPPRQAAAHLLARSFVSEMRSEVDVRGADDSETFVIKKLLQACHVVTML